MLTPSSSGPLNSHEQEFAKALADITEAIRLRPGDANAFGVRGLIYQSMGDHVKALADFTEAVRLGTTIAVKCMWVVA